MQHACVHSFLVVIVVLDRVVSLIYILFNLFYILHSKQVVVVHVHVYVCVCILADQEHAYR